MSEACACYHDNIMNLNERGAQLNRILLNRTLTRNKIKTLQGVKIFSKICLSDVKCIGTFESIKLHNQHMVLLANEYHLTTFLLFRFLKQCFWQT